MLSDMDINAIAGTLKLYFRELPEPLLTDRLYPAFMEGIGEASGVLKVGWAKSPRLVKWKAQDDPGIPSVSCPVLSPSLWLKDLRVRCCLLRPSAEVGPFLTCSSVCVCPLWPPLTHSSASWKHWHLGKKAPN